MNESEPKFPIEVKSDTGRVFVKVHFTPVKKGEKVYDAYTVDAGLVNGARKRAKRSALKDALKMAKEIANKIANGQTAVLQLSNADADILARVKKLIEPSRKSLETIATEYLQATNLLGDVPLSEAARYYLEHNRTIFVPKTIIQLLESYKDLKRAEGVSELHLDNIGVFLKRAAEYFTSPIHKITANDFNTWIAGLKDKKMGEPLEAQSKLNFRTALMAFFNSSLARQHLPANWNAFKAADGKSLVIRPKVIKKAAKIYTPEEITLLLYGASGFIDLPTAEMKTSFEAEGKKLRPLTEKQKAGLRELVPFLAIGAFGATRTSLRDGEISELDWNKIDLVNDQIDLDDGTAKVDDRYIKIQPNLKEWLLPFKKSKGPIVPKNCVKRRRLLCKLVNIAWKLNGLRKSYISYRIAQIQDAGKVAAEAGNSPEMIYTRYRKPLTQELGERWFKIFPLKEDGNIVNLEQRKAA